ncbi:NUDIX domain-containing protein [Mucilaginibacter sp. Bleaf8]|uniref:NUDIX domain-containing protein n=1 Tax=Mucilaginibacter sp. Bleaf8 TaxID=2834430 RepID=UPI001BCCC21C|nr:NUDIX domain-containing protein [Mucilaginibacter sp. Bleaf8]MBS7563399.1 NUDIX domain-containing protein [Mucilaginibacter sp. Bleaf8]
MPRQSAGILLYRIQNNQTEVFLVHPGGPYFLNKDLGAWSIPKGEYPDDEEPLTAARREFAEETGQTVNGTFLPLPAIKQKGGKVVQAWAVEGNIDPETVVSNTFRMEYPYKSGKWITVPEVDKAAWFDLETAKAKINAAQAALVTALEQVLNTNAG